MAATLIVTTLILAITKPGHGVWQPNPSNDDNPSRATEWGYTVDNGPATWPDTYATCGGVAQSPIDLPAAPEVLNPGEVVMVGYNLEMGGNVTNNGHSLTFTFGVGATPYIHGGRLPQGERFDFLQLHWHWGSNSSQGSEHTVGGKEYPMEIHLVHVNSKYSSPTEAVQNSDGLAVLGFFYEVSETDNAQLTDILSVASTVRRRSLHAHFCNTKCDKPGTAKRSKACKRRCGGDHKARSIQGMKWRASNTVEVPASIKLSQLIPGDTTDYYYYQGGLTTPTCDEVVLWTNFLSTVPVSETQLDVFRALTDSSGLTLSDNFRPPQPLNERKVYATKAMTANPLQGLDLLGAGMELMGTGALALALTAGIVAAPLLIPPPPSPRVQSRAYGNLRAGQQTYWG